LISAGSIVLLPDVHGRRGGADLRSDPVDRFASSWYLILWLVCTRVARCYIFKQKNPNLGKFQIGLQKKYIGKFYGRLVYFTTIWYILWSF
jgi:hypothetical protein